MFIIKNFNTKRKFQRIIHFNKKMLSDNFIKVEEKDKNIKIFDIAANLSDEKFKGIYNGKKYHDEDIKEVLERAKKANVNKMLFAAGCIEDAHESYILSKLSRNL